MKINLLLSITLIMISSSLSASYSDMYNSNNIGYHAAYRQIGSDLTGHASNVYRTDTQDPTKIGYPNPTGTPSYAQPYEQRYYYDARRNEMLLRKQPTQIPPILQDPLLLGPDIEGQVQPSDSHFRAQN